MDIRKEAIEFIPNLKSFNSIIDEVLASEDINIEEYDKMVEFGANLNNIPRFEALVMGIALYEDENTRNMLMKAIEVELERFILVYAHESEHISNYHKWKKEELKIYEKLEPLAGRIKSHTELSTMACEAIDAIRRRINDDDSEYDNTSTLKLYLRKIVECHQKATEELQNGYSQYVELCALEERYAYNKFYSVFVMLVNFYNILSKYIPKDVHSNDAKVKLIVKLQEECEEYNPEHDYSEELTLDERLNIIKPSEDSLSLFDMEFLSKIHKLCCGSQFEDISQIDFFLLMNNNASSCKLVVKSGEKTRVCYLIHLLSYQIEDTTHRTEWRSEILKNIGISENYYRSKYKEPIIDVPSKKSEEFVLLLQEIMK